MICAGTKHDPFAPNSNLCTSQLPTFLFLIHQFIQFYKQRLRKIEQDSTAMLPIRILSLIALTYAAYSPDNHDDWTLLKPTAASLKGSYSSLPFRFGIIANPFNLEKVGEVMRSEAAPAIPMTDSSVAPLDTSTYSVLETEDADNIEAESINSASVSNYVDTHELNSRHGEFSLEKRRAAAPEESTVSSNNLPVLVPVSCSSETVLQLTLEDGILRLTGDRIGSIVSNHQFQFDGPVPQHGAIYAAGWLVTSDGLLSLGNQTVFYQCTSGDFYKLFNESIGSQCSPVQLDVIELISC